MSLKGFDTLGEKSKVAMHKVLNDSAAAHASLQIGTFGGKNPHSMRMGLKSNSKASINPTSDSDENGRAPQINGDESMTPSSKGGASGDGPTPGYNGSGSGIAELNSAHGNISKRKAY